VSQFSDYFEAAILNWFRGTTFPAATGSVYLGLHTTATNDAGGGTEVSGNDYARQALTKDTGTWTSPDSSGVISNVDPVVFPDADPGAWGTVTHGALWDASTDGNMLMHGPLVASKTIAAGDIIRFLAGSLTITVA
jgi:hypothetical protein